MELDILHQSRSSYIVEFYGAFFIESCVYYCMEYMDAGSLDKLYGGGIPEDVLAKITFAVRHFFIFKNCNKHLFNNNSYFINRW